MKSKVFMGELKEDWGINQSYILSSTLSPMSFLSFWLLLTMWYLPRDRKQWKDIRVTFLSLLLWLDCSLKSTGLSHRETSCLRWQVGEAQQWGKPHTHLSAGESLGKLSFPSLPPEMAPHSDPSKGFIWAINGGEYLLFTLFDFYFVKE